MIVRPKLTDLYNSGVPLVDIHLLLNEDVDEDMVIDKFNKLSEFMYAHKGAYGDIPSLYRSVILIGHFEYFNELFKGKIVRFSESGHDGTYRWNLEMDLMAPYEFNEYIKSIELSQPGDCDDGQPLLGEISYP